MKLEKYRSFFASPNRLDLEKEYSYLDVELLEGLSCALMAACLDMNGEEYVKPF